MMQNGVCIQGFRGNRFIKRQWEYSGPSTVRKDLAIFRSDALSHDGSKNVFLAYVRKDFVECQSD